MKRNFTAVLFVIIYTFSTQLLNAQSAKLLWQKPTSGYSLRFSQDGKLLITGGSLGTCYPFYCGKIEVWNVADGSLRNTISPQPLMGLVNDIDINKNNSTIISGNGTVYCAGDGGCSADKPGQYKFSLDGSVKKSLSTNDNIYAIEYSPDEAYVASGTGYNNTGVIKIYDTTFNLLRTLPGHQYNTYSVAFTPDNKYLISGGDDEYLKFWDYKTGELVRSLRHGSYFNGGTDLDVDASADGKYVSSAGQGTNVKVKVWSQINGQLIYTFTIPNTDAYSGYSTARFSGDSKYIAAGTIEYTSSTGYFGEVFIWRLSDGKLVKKIVDKDDDGNPNTGGIRVVAFSETDSLFAYIANGILKVFSINDGFAENANEKLVAKNTITIEAFPNPFTSQTKISYSVPSKEFVNLTVYNVYGKPIKVLVNEHKSAGNYYVQFDGAGLTPGTYMYKLSIGNNIVSKSIVLTSSIN